MTMTENERVTYAELAIQIEMERLGTVFLYTKDVWEEKFLSRADVDPLNVHKLYGLVTPQLVDNKWMMGFSAFHLIKPLENHDDRDLNLWLQYWFAHTALHFVILDWAINLGDRDLPLEEVERRVEAEMEAHGRDFYQLGEKIKLSMKAAGQ